MLNLLSFMVEANSGYVRLEDHEGVTRKLLYDLANRCGFRVIEKEKRGSLVYRLKKLPIPCEKLYSRENRASFNFIDIADLHIGHPDCEISRIKMVLDDAIRQNVDFVFISGDIFEGIPIPSNPISTGFTLNKNKVRDEFERQLEMAFKLFRRFPLCIKATPGNHDFLFDVLDFMNPLKTLEMELRRETCDFKAYNGYIQDFEIAGVIKRMIHLENYYFQPNVFPAIHRLHEFEQNEGLIVGGKKPVRFLQCGHFHKTAEFYNSEYKVFITQPGSFICGQNYYTPAIHVKGEVLDDLRVLRE